MEKCDIFTLDLLGKSFLEWGKSFKNLVEIFTPASRSVKVKVVLNSIMQIQTLVT